MLIPLAFGRIFFCCALVALRTKLKALLYLGWLEQRMALLVFCGAPPSTMTTDASGQRQHTSVAGRTSRLKLTPGNPTRGAAQFRPARAMAASGGDLGDEGKDLVEYLPSPCVLRQGQSDIVCFRGCSHRLALSGNLHVEWCIFMFVVIVHWGISEESASTLFRKEAHRLRTFKQLFSLSGTLFMKNVMNPTSALHCRIMLSL